MQQIAILRIQGEEIPVLMRASGYVTHLRLAKTRPADQRIADEAIAEHLSDRPDLIRKLKEGKTIRV